MNDADRISLENQLDGLEAAIKAYPPLGQMLRSLWQLKETADPRHDAGHALYAVFSFLSEIPRYKGVGDAHINSLAQLLFALQSLDDPGITEPILQKKEGTHGKGFATSETVAHDIRARVVQSNMELGDKRDRAAQIASSHQPKRRLTGKEFENQYRQQTKKSRTPIVRPLAVEEHKPAVKLADKLDKPK